MQLGGSNRKVPSATLKKLEILKADFGNRAAYLRPSANDKYFRVRARVRAPDFEPGADKKFLIENSIPWTRIR